MPNDTVIVSSWEQFVAALAGGASYIKWADAAVKQINVANISSKLICRCNEVDFNGWTIDTLNIYGIDDYYAFYREDWEYGYGHYGIFRTINLTVNHFNVFNTAKACIIVFGYFQVKLHAQELRLGLRCTFACMLSPFSCV